MRSQENNMKRLFSFRKTQNLDTNELKRALYHADLKTIKEFVKNGLDVNQQIESFDSDSILIRAILCSPEKRGSKQHIGVIEYLLSQDADINQFNKDGYNSLHIALSHHDLSRVSLSLLQNCEANVNLADKPNGNTPLFIAIREYGLTWREDQKEVNRLRYKVIEKLLNRGAQLDHPNIHGVTPRFWTERLNSDDPIHALLT